jgi:hypothetical protein
MTRPTPPRISGAGKGATWGRATTFLALLALTSATSIVAAPVVLRGARLGWVIERALPAMRGRIEVGGGRWTWSTIYALLRERPAPLVLENVRVTDPEGVVVLRVGRAQVRLELRRAPVRVVLHDLRVENADWRFAGMARERKIGFLAAFEVVGAPPPGDRHRPDADAASATPSWELSIPDARLEGLGVELDFADWGLVLRDVHASAGLAFSQGGGPGPSPSPAMIATSRSGSAGPRAARAARADSFSFDVAGADALGGGRLRILGGARPLVLPFARARLDRVGTDPAAPDSLALVASGIATGASRLGLTAAFTGIYGRSSASRHPGLFLDARIDDAADAVRAVSSGRGPALGPGARLTLHFAGPFTDLEVKATLESERLGHGAAGLKLDRRGLTGDATFTRFALASLLPRQLAPFLGGALDGELRGHAGFDGAVALELLDLTLTRPTSAGAPRVVRAHVAGRLPLAPAPTPPDRRADLTLDLSGLRYSAGRIHLPELVVPLLGGRARAHGSVAIRDPLNAAWLDHPELELELSGERLSIEPLLGVTFVKGALDVRARVSGPLDRLAIALTLPRGASLSVLDERFTLPDHLLLGLADGVLSFPDVRLGGPRGSTFDASGGVGLPGPLAIDVAVRDFPIARVPGLAQAVRSPLDGAISGRLRLSGPPEQPAISGTLTLDPLTFQGQSLGAGTIVVAPAPRGAIWVRGHLLAGITAEARLSPGRSGLSGDATVTLTHVRLDPFVPGVIDLLDGSGGLRATGIVSGQVVARVRPGQPASADARLSELTLTATPLGSPDRSSAAAAPRAPMELHSDGELKMHAETGAGPLTVGPVRLRGNVGDFVLWSEHRDELARATLRGRLDLGALAPLSARWLDHQVGTLDVDLTATARVDRTAPVIAFRAPSLTGDVTVDRALGFRWTAMAGLPVDVSVPTGGRLRLTGTAVETTALAVDLRAANVAGGALRRIEANARIDARIGVGGRVEQPARGRARVSLDQIVAEVPALGPSPVRSEHGRLDVESRGARIDVVAVDLPARGAVRGLDAPGVHVTGATYAVRLTGDPRRHMTLSGEAEIEGARVRADALSAPPRPGASTAGRAAGAAPATEDAASALAARPEVARSALDLRLRARGGAVVVEIPHLPDLRVNLDLRVGGTVAHPTITGAPRGANLYSALLLRLGQLFH